MAGSRVRLTVLAVLLASMVVVLVGRTVQLQAGDAVGAARAEQGSRVRDVVEPAPRGVILDQAGRPLAANRQQLQLVADRDALLRQPQDGGAVLAAAASVLATTAESLDARLRPCSPPGAPGGCWDGSDPAAVMIARNLSMEQALPFLEQPEAFPGLAVRTVTVRGYPSPEGARAAHLLGHLGAATQQEVEGGAAPEEQFGRGGLEQRYDTELRGAAGTSTVLLNSAGRQVQTLAESPALPGSSLITSIDAHLQAVVEQELAAAVARARAAGAGFAADSGSAVVVDVTDGRVLALASYPDFEPAAFVGGISETDYRALSDSGALRSNPWQGSYAPGSTFKPFTVVGMQRAGVPLDASLPCPGTYSAGGRSFGNDQFRAYGTIPLARAIEVSCNTVFYAAADGIWRSTVDSDADPIHDAARDFGLGTATGIDLPGEARGVLDGRSEKSQQWRANRAKWCAAADGGYPELRRTDPALADRYTQLDRENCDSGGRWRQGDALNASIGQGLTAVTPLQLAMAYAAIANGGTRYQPQLVKAVVAPDGTVESREPVVAGAVPVAPATLQFLTTAMVGVTRQGTAASAFAGFPLDRVPVAGKTGSAQVTGGAGTSWFASFAPADRPRYAVVVMVTQGGTGSATSAPAARGIYEALFGVVGGDADPSRGVLGGPPRSDLPSVSAGGQP